MTTPLHREKIYSPQINLAELIRKNAGGVLKERGDLERSIFRAIVVGVDTIGGRLENPLGKPEGGSEIEEIIKGTDGSEVKRYKVKTRVGIRNPADSVKAKIIAPNMDTFTPFDQLRVYWPLFPGFHAPTAGELVYVMFEDEDANNGLWLCEVPNNLESDNANTVLMLDIIKGQDVGSKSLMSKFDPAAPRATSQSSYPGSSSPPRRISDDPRWR